MSNGLIPSLELSRKVGISINSVNLCARKVKYAIIERNNIYRIFGTTEHEHDEIYIEVLSKNG